MYVKKCDGYGTKDKTKSNCETCNGSGKANITRRIGNMIQQIVSSCPDCNGTGEKIKRNNIYFIVMVINLKIKIEV